MLLCEVCGNSFDPAESPEACPYCGAACGAGAEGRTRGYPIGAEDLHRTVNLEWGKPLVKQALTRLEAELATCRLLGARVLTLIHGYGSSGQGGAIREAVRQRLFFLESAGEVENVIFGEDFEGRSGYGRQILRRYTFLKTHPDLNRRNPGITVAFLPGSPRAQAHGAFKVKKELYK